jgi:hypothetical protein
MTSTEEKEGLLFEKRSKKLLIVLAAAFPDGASLDS